MSKRIVIMVGGYGMAAAAVLALAACSKDTPQAPTEPASAPTSPSAPPNSNGNPQP